VINISSMYASFGSPRNPAYGASKAAVTQLTKSLAIAWAPDGIRVNAVAPGFIVTEQSAKSRQDPQHVANVSGPDADGPVGAARRHRGAGAVPRLARGGVHDGNVSGRRRRVFGDV
jgi:NAD(P)-dependent dehydrogenase (short-subunit alcohol dehydrogenase family)